MKASEFRKLIREEVRRVLKEVAGNSDRGYEAIEYAVDAEDGEAAAKFAKEEGTTKADIIASFQSGEWKNSFVPRELADFLKAFNFNEPEIDAITTSLNYTPNQKSQLKALLKDIKGAFSSTLKQIFGSDKDIEQYDNFQVLPNLVSIRITPIDDKAALKLYSALEANKGKLANYLQSNNLPKCSLFLGSLRGESYLKILISSKPTRDFIPTKQTTI